MSLMSMQRYHIWIYALRSSGSCDYISNFINSNYVCEDVESIQNHSLAQAHEEWL